MKQLFLVALFFILLAVASLVGFPGEFIDKPYMRGLRMLDDILSLFAGTAGPVVGAGRILAVGAAVVGIGYLRQRRARRQAQPELPAAGAGSARVAEATRRRTFGKAEGREAIAPTTTSKGEIARLMGADPASPEANDTRPADQADHAALITAIVEANMPKPPPDGPLDPAIEAGWTRAIVFRETFPPTGEATLSFYGGAPVGPADLEWPRGVDGKPLTFIMQCHCPEVAAHDPTGLFPRTGVLWFFMDMTWEAAENFSFLHRPGPVDGWTAIAPPPDMGAPFGRNGAHYLIGCTDKVEDPEQYVPRLLPWSPFVPMGIATDRRPDDDGEADWSGIHLPGRALLDAQNAIGEPVPVEHVERRKKPFARPFPEFPHDFGAVRVLAATVVEELSSMMFLRSESPLKDMPEEDRQALIARWLEEARDLYLFAAGQDAAAPVDRELADQVWAWAASCEPAFGWKFEGAVTDSVDASFGARSRATGVIPPEWVALAAKRHVLASEYDRWEHPDRSLPDCWKVYEERKARGELAVVRELHRGAVNQMFGTPSYVQGYVEEYVFDHLLLLELQANGAPGHHFGEGVLQYLIRPEDLAAGRFDKVKPVLSAY